MNPDEGTKISALPQATSISSDAVVAGVDSGVTKKIPATLLKGQQGPQGEDGKSAYQIAVENGFKGTEEEWLESLDGKNGTDGKSAYQIAQENGFTGTEQEWLESLVGPEGTQGQPGSQGEPGKQGEPGPAGQDGFSPSVSVNVGEDGKTTISVTDKDGTTDTEILTGGKLYDTYGENTDGALTQKFLTSKLQQVRLGVFPQSDSKGAGVIDPIVIGAATANGTHSIAIGQQNAQSTTAVGEGIAIGAGAQAKFRRSVAIGTNNPVTSRENEVSFGHTTADGNFPSQLTSFLANVAAGELDTDAVNLKQMNEAIQEKISADLANYYTKTQVDQQISTIPKFAIEVVTTLPTTDISSTTVYLVPSDASSTDLYTEYIYVNNKWEPLGTQSVDLTNYLTKDEATGLYVPNTRKVNNKALSSDISLTASDVGALAADGTAVSATQLATARTFRTNLASTSAVSFNGTASVTPGVTGTLPIANGGTGATTASAALTALGAQAKLISGTNIKTINGESLLGAGEITTGGLVAHYVDDTPYFKFSNDWKQIGDIEWEALGTRIMFITCKFYGSYAPSADCSLQILAYNYNTSEPSTTYAASAMMAMPATITQQGMSFVFPLLNKYPQNKYRLYGRVVGSPTSFPTLQYGTLYLLSLPL